MSKKANKDDIFIALLDYYLDGAQTGENVDFLMEHKIPTIAYTEEFSIILEDLTLKKAIEIFEKLRVKIEESIFEEGDIKIPITVSIGLFYGFEHSMLKKADEKLYEAKNSGRNRLKV